MEDSVAPPCGAGCPPLYRYRYLHVDLAVKLYARTTSKNSALVVAAHTALVRAPERRDRGVDVGAGRHGARGALLAVGVRAPQVACKEHLPQVEINFFGDAYEVTAVPVLVPGAIRYRTGGTSRRRYRYGIAKGVYLPHRTSCST